MEGAALNRPPEWLEGLVLLLTPPAAREAVMGDLCETYHSPLQYAGEALGTLPLVIASQMRRNLNLPALGLQGFLFFFLAGGFSNPARALNVTALVLPLLVIRGAYQPTERQSSRRAMGETVMVVIAMILFSLSLAFKVHAAHSRIADDVLWLQLTLLAPMMFPALCLFRAGLMVEGDWRRPFPPGTCRGT